MAELERAYRIMHKDALRPFVERLMAQMQVVAPQEHDTKFAYKPLARFEDMRLDYVRTLLPMKKVMFPQREPFLRFSLEGQPQAEAVTDGEPTALIGVHPCDAHAIWCLDTAFSDNHADPNYLARRSQMLIIGSDCMPDEYCFCASMGTHLPRHGYDLFLTDIGDKYTVEIATARGQQALAGAEGLAEPTAADFEAQDDSRRRKVEAMQERVNIEVSRLPLLLSGAWDSKVWQQEAERCYSCGSCNLVCSTCFCFDVLEEVTLDLKGGARERQWDSCMLEGFAKVASGENFRPTREGRLRHRLCRKMQYLFTRYGEVFCTGCGRCSQVCLVKIQPPKIINLLVEESAGRAV